MFVVQLRRSEETPLRTLHRYFLPSLVPFGPVVSEEKIITLQINGEGQALYGGKRSHDPSGQLS